MVTVIFPVFRCLFTFALKVCNIAIFWIDFEKVSKQNAIFQIVDKVYEWKRNWLFEYISQVFARGI